MELAILDDNQTKVKKRQFCSFYIDNHLFGVDILDVKEIKDEFTITKVFHSPKEVLGFVNIRGNVHLVLDISMMLGFSSKPVDEKNRVVLFKSVVDPSFGILVDQIDDMITVKQDMIVDVADEDFSNLVIISNHSKIINGICKLDHALLLLIDTKKLLGAVDKDLY